MWVSRKRMDALEKRLRDLEAKSVAVTWEFGKVDFPTYTMRMSRLLSEKENSRAAEALENEAKELNP